MKKKTLVLSMIVVMLFSICIPASLMAASPELGQAGINIAGSTVPAGGSLTATAATAATQTAINNYAAQVGVKGMLVGVMDINYAGPDADKVVVRVDVANLKAGQVVTVVHQKADGSFATHNATSYAGYFTFVPGSFSPFGFYVDAAIPAAPAAGSTTAKSPQTGVYL